MDDLAATRVHVLVVGVPGFPLLRLRALAALRRRGWTAAASPVDADVLLVCGAPGEDLRQAVDAAWARVPAPRARRTALDAGALEGLLDSAARVLADRALQAAARTSAPSAAAPDDRRLGPVLPDWPPGLVVEPAPDGGGRVTALPGDGAEDEPLGEHDAAFVQACDRAARVLRLAGWPAEARRLDRCADAVLAGLPAASRLPQVRRSAARVGRSALLRADLAPVPGEALHRLLVILGDAERGALGEPVVDEPVDPDRLADALRGVPADQVRLVVAIAGADPEGARQAAPDASGVAASGQGPATEAAEGERPAVAGDAEAEGRAADSAVLAATAVPSASAVAAEDRNEARADAEPSPERDLPPGAALQREPLPPVDVEPALDAEPASEPAPDRSPDPDPEDGRA